MQQFGAVVSFRAGVQALRPYLTRRMLRLAELVGNDGKTVPQWWSRAGHTLKSCAIAGVVGRARPRTVAVMRLPVVTPRRRMHACFVTT